jgi:RND family efflux transporter MFP subunit
MALDFIVEARTATVIALVVFSVGCGRNIETVSGPKSSTAPVRVAIATVRLEDTVKVYEATGTVKPKFNSALSSKVLARVVAVNVREGDSVRKGQVLVTLDSRELRSAVSMAEANRNATSVAIQNAEAAYLMELRTSAARVAESEAQVGQAKAALAIANSRLDLARAGTRTQEKAQASLAVNQAASNLKFAAKELERAQRLVDEGAVPRRQLDVAQNAYNLAKAQHDSAIEAEKIAVEGSRSQDIRAAEEAVVQAEAAVRQAEAGLKSARASTMMVRVRSGDIQAARAQAKQSSAALESAVATAGYAAVTSPFDGRVVRRHVDPGTMAAPGAPMLVLEGEELRLEAIVPESVVGHVSLGSMAPVLLESLSSATFDSKTVELVPQGDSASHSFLARFSLPKDIRLKSGMFGRVQIPIGRQRRILIPESASWEVEGLRYVYVVNVESIARLRIVTVGQQFGNRLQVLTGLSEGEAIVIGDLGKVQDGTLVEAS